LKSITVTVGSVTYALKLKKLLNRGGIEARLIKVEDKNGLLGCLHGVRLKEADFLDAVVIMRENNISYSVYE